MAKTTATTYEEWQREKIERSNRVTEELRSDDVTEEAMGRISAEIDDITRTDELWELRTAGDKMQADQAKGKELSEELRADAPSQIEYRDHAADLVKLGVEKRGEIELRMDVVEREQQMLALGMTAKDIVERRDYELRANPDKTQWTGFPTSSGYTADDTKGGYLIPTDLERRIYVGMTATPGIRNAGAEIIRTSSGNERDLPILTRPDPETTGRAELAEGADLDIDTLTYSQIVLRAYKYTFAHMVTDEVVQDAPFNLEQQIADSFSWQLARRTEQRYTLGTGTLQPKGMIHGVTKSSDNVKIAASKDAITYQDLHKILYDLDVGYFSDPVNAYAGSPGSLCWMMNASTYANIIASVGTDQHPIFGVSTTDMQTRSFLGYPVKFNVFYPDALGTVDTLAVTIGNFYRHYIIRDVASMKLSVSPHIKFLSGQVVYKLDFRTDGVVRDSDAVRHLFTAAS